MILLLLRSMAEELGHEKDAMFDEIFRELQDLRQHMKVSACMNNMSAFAVTAFDDY
jgi:peroxiredoxin family protein